MVNFRLRIGFYLRRRWVGDLAILINCLNLGFVRLNRDRTIWFVHNSTLEVQSQDGFYAISMLDAPLIPGWVFVKNQPKKSRLEVTEDNNSSASRPCIWSLRGLPEHSSSLRSGFIPAISLRWRLSLLLTSCWCDRAKYLVREVQ